MSTSKVKALFNGCSVTLGGGFSNNADRDLYVYDRLVSQRYNFDRTNIASGGTSNFKIFMSTCDALLSNKYDIVFNQWAPLSRLWLSPGPGAHFSVTHASPVDSNGDPIEFKYNDLWIRPKEYAELQRILIVLNHDYQNILDIMSFCDVINSLSKSTNTPVVYINGAIPWQEDLITPLGTDLNASLSDYSKTILDFENRSDEEIILYYTVLQEKFAKLDQSKWVNLFNCIRTSMVDLGPDGHHPGARTYQLIADQVCEYLDTHKILDNIKKI